MRLELDAWPGHAGWAPDGHVLAVGFVDDQRVIESCDPTDGSCEEIGSPEGDVSLVLGAQG